MTQQSFDVTQKEQNIKDLIRPSMDRRYMPYVTVEWLNDMSLRAKQARLPMASVRRIVSDLSWEDRDRGTPVATWDEYMSAAAGRPEIDASALQSTLAWYISQRRRFDYQFHSIMNESSWWPNTIHDAQLQAVIALAEFGLRLPTAMQRLEAAKKLPDCDHVVMDILLQGLCFSAVTEEEAQRILELSGEMGELAATASTTHYRRAIAYRIMKNPARARAEILMAMETLAPGRNDVHQEYVREYQLISALEG